MSVLRNRKDRNTFSFTKCPICSKNLGDEDLFEHIHKEHPDLEHQFRTSNFINENNGLIRCHKCNYFFTSEYQELFHNFVRKYTSRLLLGCI